MENIIVEIRAGEGGKDSKLFAKDMSKMYVHYAENSGCTVD
jgi:peptide chain release factor 1